MKLYRILNNIRSSRSLRILFLMLALIMLATIVPPAPPQGVVRAADSIVIAEAVPIDEGAPRRRRVGALVFVGGWNLESPESRFGGISAMQVEGEMVTAISDAGDLFRFALPRTAGARPLRVEPLSASATAKISRDTEAFQLLGDQAWIAFERQNGIARYRRRDWTRTGFARPAPMRRWRANNGPEAMVRLPGGRFLVFAEGRSEAAFSPVILFEGDPSEPTTAYRVLRYRPPAGFRPTDAALLPDGRLLILNRRFAWIDEISASLAIATGPGLSAGVTIGAREVARLRAPLTVDNMEALAVTREGGRTIVRIASDDNFMAVQRTLLLEFALEERAPEA